MRDEDKPFICYRQNKWLFQITPRNLAGWRSFGLWMLSFLAATAGYLALVTALEARGVSETVIGLLAIPFLIATAVWVIFMIRWMLARSQIIDMNAVAKFQQEQERQAKKRGRL
jgi:predicted Kef-type K+ transport protein